jgi:hypothetical protein
MGWHRPCFSRGTPEVNLMADKKRRCCKLTKNQVREIVRCLSILTEKKKPIENGDSK